MRRSREFVLRVQTRADSILERLTRQPNALVIISNAMDPLRPDSRTGQRMRKLEEDFDIIDWPIFDECHHEPRTSRCPQPSWRMEVVRRCLRRERQHEVLRDLLARKKLLVMGRIAQKTMQKVLPCLGSHATPVAYIPHAAEWMQLRHNTAYTVLAEHVTNFYTKTDWNSFLSRTQATAEMIQQNMSRIASDAARAASGATGKISGRLLQTRKVRHRMGRMQAAYLSTAKGKREQAAKGKHMAAIRDEATTQANATAAKRKRFDAVSASRSVTEEQLRGHVAAGWDKAQIANEYLLTYKQINDLKPKDLHIPEKTQRKRYPLTDKTANIIRKGRELGMSLMQLNFVCDRPLDPEDISEVLFPKYPDSRGRPRKNKSAPNWATEPAHAPINDFGNWLSTSDAQWLVQVTGGTHRAAIFMCRMRSKACRADECALWADFFDKISSGEPWCGQTQNPVAFAPSKSMVAEIVQRHNRDEDVQVHNAAIHKQLLAASVEKIQEGARGKSSSSTRSAMFSPTKTEE